MLAKQPKVIISGGGTGGHIYPALAIANEIRSRYPQAEILFVGALGRMEMQKVPEAGYKIIGLPIAGIQRKAVWKNIGFPFKLVNSLLAAFKIVEEFKPDIAIGVGGYASAPTLYAASLRGVPTLIQEQNSYAGLTNRLLARRAKKICVAYPNLEKYFPADKLVYTGNPVRSDILDISHKKAEARALFGMPTDAKVLLVIGGSLGARTINQCLATQYAELEAAGIYTIWQTGKVFSEKAIAIFEKSPSDKTKAMPFLNQMDMAYAAADIVISRAGALSISELCLTGKPCILVPSPNVTDDHQTKNALALVNNNAALMVDDTEVDVKLIPEVLALFANEELQETLSNNIRIMAKPSAAIEIVNEVEAIIG
jgi:UDP-N-acetylglucosamine--N-acetylmuramyl-(pentapeptide) pyrophosphoryl-undecaprenol N-acetylglucosamine transferase